VHATWMILDSKMPMGITQKKDFRDILEKYNVSNFWNTDLWF
jgi:hypothetical protein